MRQRARTPEERLAGLLELQSLLARVSREIGPALELQPVLTTVLTAMRSLVDFTGGTIGLIDERGVYVAASDPPVSDEVAASRVAVGTGLAGRVVAAGRTIYSPDLDADVRVDPVQRRLGSNARMRSYLGVPLVVLGKTIGLVQVDSSEIDAFDADDLAVLEGLATQVAGAIESARRHEEIIELERLKSDFIARVSHELKTPLTIISGFVATMLNRADNLTATQQTWLERIAAADIRLSSLIDELLTVTSFEAGAAAPNPEDVAVADTLRQVRAGSLDPERVTVSCPPTLHLVADPNLLRHALGLLVDNALKYAGDADVSAGVDLDGISCFVSVRDHGGGVPAHLRPRLYERFTRGDHNQPGMGLGLAIVRNLAGGLGARVELSDPPDGGACFTLHFG